MVTPFRHRLARLAEPYVLFPVFALLGLSILWGATYLLLRAGRTNVERAALASTRELAETYEAQVVRAVREIDLTLKAVKYAYESGGGSAVLEDLKSRALLPPDLLFVVSIADPGGDIVASTRPLAIKNVADRRVFKEQRESDTLSVGQPLQDSETGEWVVRFGRRLAGTDGAFAGVALVTVGADFFVSGYEETKLGSEGLLGILGVDGVFIARRTGDTVKNGEKVDYATTMRGADQEEIGVRLTTNPWDGVLRYTSARQLYDLPLTVVVGLSRAEQLAKTDSDARAHLWRASAGSFLLLLVVAALGRMSRQLALSRRLAVAAQVEHAKQVEHLAYHDGLTGLPNRSLFSKLLHQAIQVARRHRRQLAVLFLDLDRFKHINDTLGHEAGDQLLQEVAKRLRACVRESDLAARLGGDEFVVMLPELAEAGYAGTVAQKMISMLGKPFVLLGQEFRVTGSVGIATYPQDGADEQTLTKNADIAMYKAKELGKNNFQFYSPAINSESLERLTLESSLRRALENDEFILHYQAKRDLMSGLITGMEALLRWQSPDLGLIPPMRFIPIAEQSGLSAAIGKWVLRTACAQNVTWQNEGLPRLSMAVNLSTLQFFDAHLLADVSSILVSSGMDPKLLELEITEVMLMQDVPRTLRILTALKEIGVRIAVDDFGLGYTTLTSLQQFPLDTIKIDRTFIRDVANVAEDKALTEAIIAMGKSLSVTVVAQGVETKAQVDFLREHACDELQGFYFNRPVSASEFGEVLRVQARAPGVTEIAAHLTEKHT
ncbi:MAG: EAL domain-containing protein [Thermoanaerobaculia bacterium]